ncbi:MAG: cation diffusion facilitator family transporter [Geodermatophilaceae bacterium]|nr:cation diffusion facilitator family transporter [Geodermatophilaceae bacterium]
MSTAGGTKAIIAAMLANAGIAIAKFVAFLITGASSLLAESVHSAADTSNQALLLLGGKRAKRQATPEHPFGYGRERYIYAFIVSIVLFSLGGLFALYEGYHKIELVLDGESELVSPLVAIVVLVVAIALETFSLRTAIVESNHVRGSQSWVQFIRHSRAPELPVVLLEDIGAEIGLILALLGVGLSAITGNGIYDGIGTMGIGLLLVIIAVILAIETKSLLLGESATETDVAKIRAAIMATEDVEGIIHMRTLHLGPDELLVAAKIAVAAEVTAADVAAGIDATEKRIRDAVPIARVIYLEPDLRRPSASPAAQNVAAASESVPGGG